jgi:hypothetical protein
LASEGYLTGAYTGVNGWLMDVFKGWDFEEVVRRFDRHDWGIIEMFRREARKLLGEYLTEATGRYYDYVEGRDTERIWTRGMKQALLQAHKEVSIEVMVQKYGLLFDSVLDGTGAKGYEEKYGKWKKAQEVLAGESLRESSEELQMAGGFKLFPER